MERMGPEAVPRTAASAIRRKLHRRLYRRMYWWRVGCFAALLLLVPLARIGLNTLLLRTQVLSHFADCRATKYGRLWYCTCGDDRNRLTEPLNDREQRIWEGVVVRAREHKFVFRDPAPVRTTAEADLLDPPPTGEIYGEAFPSGRIMLSSKGMNAMSDDEVAIVMAHELGHHIDMQRERTGHPVLNRLAFADPEAVAWGVATELYGGDAVGQWRQKWQSRFVSFD